jgi:hypothetical protein
VPSPTPRWRRTVDGACGLTRSLQQVPGLTGLVTGPVALVGRSMLRMYVDREQQPGGPPYRLDTAALREATGGGGARRTQLRTARRAQRGDDVGVGPHVPPSPRAALAALSHPVDRPIDSEDVRIVASEGFPLWEPVEVMVHRNRRITVAYADLSQRLADVLAGDGGVLDANWCTFATWSSKTIGTFIEDIPRVEAVAAGADPASVMPDHRGLLAPQIARVTLQLMTRSDGASFRTLAAGNRAVFLEIGLSVATFLEHFPDRSAAAGDDAEGRWVTYWKAVDEQLAEMATFDPSWLLTPRPGPDDLRLGLRQYFRALRADDQHLRSQHVLAGNLLLGAYEQRRVDGYVWAALSLFTERAMRRLIRDRTGVVGGVRRWPNGLYARLMTRRMALELPEGELIRIAEPVPPPPDPRDHWHALATDADVTLPVLQALVTRYQLATGRRPNQGARNWTSFDQRMRTIGNLFRFRQRQRNLFSDPFPPAQIDHLLAGRDHIAPPGTPPPSARLASAPA